MAYEDVLMSHLEIDLLILSLFSLLLSPQSVIWGGRDREMQAEDHDLLVMLSASNMPQGTAA